MNLKRKFQGFILVILCVVFLGGCKTEEEYLQLSQEKDVVSNQLADLQSEHDKVLGEKAKLEEAKSKLELANADQDKEIKLLKQDLSDVEKILEARSDTLSKNIVDLRGRIADQRGHIASLNKEINQLEGKNTSLQSDKESLQSQMASLQSEKESLQSQVASLQSETEAMKRQKEQEMNDMKGTYEDLLTNMKSEIDKGKITITQLEGKLKVNMLDEILFDSGKVTIKPEGIEVLERVGEILLDVKDRSINIEGHTDNVPIGPVLAKKYPTNWELSASRATNVARYLQEKAGIDPGLLSATGYGEYHPIASNDTKLGKAKNRRIEIVLVPLEITPVSR